MSAEGVPQVKELAHRRADRLDVTLWWVKGTIDTYVTVIDLSHSPPKTTNVPVEPPASPNDVYNHPFRYLAEQPTTEIEVADGRGAE